MVSSQKIQVNENAKRVKELNKIFEPLEFEERLKKIYSYYTEDEVIFTTSFGAKSVFLIHLLHKINPNQKVHFINTTYHFEETINYMHQLRDLYNLDVVEVLPEGKQHELTKEQQWWKEHPKMCCTINKIAPLTPHLLNYKVWLTGILSTETKLRQQKRVFELQGDIIKFHPIIDVSAENIELYMYLHNLLQNPLKSMGYASIGCSYCTVKGKGRNGRWNEKTNHTECGLHVNHYYKK